MRPSRGQSAERPWPPFQAVRLFASKLIEAKSPAERRAAGDGLVEAIRTGELRGMGGAGVPAFRKWQDVRDARGEEKYIVCNADESEPATFKDRELLLRMPDLVIEGMVLAALLVRASRGYIYIRHEYYQQIDVVERGDRAGSRRTSSGRTYSTPDDRSSSMYSKAQADMSAASKAH